MVAVSEQCECPHKLPADVLSFCDEVEVCCACGELGSSCSAVSTTALHNLSIFVDYIAGTIKVCSCMCVAILSNCPHGRGVGSKTSLPRARMREQGVITPRAHARARGYVIGRGVYILYIIIIYLQNFFSIFQNTHFQTPISTQEGFSSNLIASCIP